jgi:hypothetical protein
VKGSDWNRMAQPGGVDEVGRDALQPSPPVFLFLDKISSNGFYLLLQ